MNHSAKCFRGFLRCATKWLAIALFTVPSGLLNAANHTGLEWDAVTKTVSSRPGELKLEMAYAFTNVSAAEVVIQHVATSCGCSVAKIPVKPWSLPPGTNGQINVTVDLRGRRGVLSKSVYVVTSRGLVVLGATVNIAATPPATAVAMNDRGKNIQIAKVDRQAVFKGDCARCHATPAKGKMGKELFAVACGICHEAEHRASMVPDLLKLNKPTSEVYWRQWVEIGNTTGLMPAFLDRNGGILNPKQVDSLIDFMTLRKK